MAGRHHLEHRLVHPLLLLQAGYAYVPYSALESVIEQRKDAYYVALRQTQSTIRTGVPDWQPWQVFVRRALAGTWRDAAAVAGRGMNCGDPSLLFS